HSPSSLFFFSLIRPPPSSTLFPYTTLFRSIVKPQDQQLRQKICGQRGGTWRGLAPPVIPSDADSRVIRFPSRTGASCRNHRGQRSEEHTSELQSLTNLVCRLLLEKKKKTVH